MTITVMDSELGSIKLRIKHSVTDGNNSDRFPFPREHRVMTTCCSPITSSSDSLSFLLLPPSSFFLLLKSAKEAHPDASDPAQSPFSQLFSVLLSMLLLPIFYNSVRVRCEVVGSPPCTVMGGGARMVIYETS